MKCHVTFGLILHISRANGETEKNGAIFTEMTRFQETHEKSKSHSENVVSRNSIDIKQL